MSVFTSLALYGAILATLYYFIRSLKQWTDCTSAAITAKRVAALGAVITVPVMTVYILQIRSSTGGAWLLAVPVYAAAVAGCCYALTWAMLQLRVAAAARRQSSARLPVRPVGGAVLILGTAVALLGSYLHSERLSLQARTASADEIRALYQDQSGSRDHHVLAALARNRNCPPDVLLAMAQDRHPSMHSQSNSFRSVVKHDSYPVIRYVAQHPGLPAEAREHIARNGPGDAAADIAARPDTPAKTLRVLAGLADFRVNWQLAGNSDTPTDILDRLALDDNQYTRMYVASNRGASPATLAHLGMDTKDGVRSRIAGNPRTPEQTLRTLAGDPVAEVRLAVAGNQSAPAERLETLTRDPDARISLAATNTLVRQERSRTRR